MTDKLISGQKNIVIIVFLVLLALGIFFRVYGLGERNLWIDEAWVALAATQPTPAEVLKEGKSTPPLYLLTVWGMVQVFGPSETALRLTSCLLGIGALLLFWPLALALLPPVGALTAFGLASVSERLVYFSKELKQYSADVFFAVLVFFLVERQIRRQGDGGWLWFTLLLALGLGFSHPLVFILPVAALVLWWELPEARNTLYLSFGALGLFFILYYWFFFRGQVDPELLIYWQDDFPDVTCGTNFLCWLGAGWSRFGRYFFSDWGVLLGLVFFVAGLGYFLKSSKPRVVWYFFGPLLAALAAAFAQRYPFMGRAGGVRLMMFSAPILYLVTGAGIWAIFDWLCTICCVFVPSWF
jgi:4-amino-4-deoxy-L-arabinose transferase-like glycosyltransferase